MRCCGHSEGVFGRQFNQPAKPCISQSVKIQKTNVLCIPWLINKSEFSRDPKYYPFRRYDNWRWGKGVELSQSGTKEQTVFIYMEQNIFSFGFIIFPFAVILYLFSAASELPHNGDFFGWRYNFGVGTQIPDGQKSDISGFTTGLIVSIAQRTNHLARRSLEMCVESKLQIIVDLKYMLGKRTQKWYRDKLILMKTPQIYSSNCVMVRTIVKLVLVHKHEFSGKQYIR